MIATGKSSSSLSITSSILGLPAVEGDDDGVSIGAVERASLSDSTLILATSSSSVCAIFEGLVGEGGEEGMDSRGLEVRRFMVTRLEVGACSGGSRVGVEGGASSSAVVTPSRCKRLSGILSDSLAVSTDLLRDPPRETLCRFRKGCS